MTVEFIDSMGSDLKIVNTARVSFHKESDWEYWDEDGRGPAQSPSPCGQYFNSKRLSEKDQKLIKYLAKHNHWTPFAHCQLTFRIKAPIFVARQLGKHQIGLVWNEVSRRYVSDEPEFYFPEKWRGKPVNVKQGSSDLSLTGYIDENDVYYDYATRVDQSCEISLETYKSLIQGGVAPEQARMVLPQNMMTEWWWTGSLQAFARICHLRLDPHTQQETREIVQLIHDKVPEDFQHSWKALMEKGD